MSRRNSPIIVLFVRFVDLLGFYFPGALVVATLVQLYFFVVNPTWWRFVLMLATPYVVPVFLYRLMCLFKPIKEGGSSLALGVWSSWFLSYRLQIIYAYFPSLEGALLSVPGLFSFWLRLWGSKVGKGVFWAATAQVTDRGFLNIGDKVFFGNAVYLSPHVVQRRKGKGILYFKTITIGEGSFVGAGVRMGPGVVVHPESMVPILTDLYVKEEFPPKETKDAKPASPERNAP